jgi:hypothetical protein
MCVCVCVCVYRDCVWARGHSVRTVRAAIVCHRKKNTISGKQDGDKNIVR